MASSQPYTVAVNGGLVSSSNVIDLLKTPGVAKDLRNFEVSTEGGYRRINGYQKFGTTNATKPTGSVTNILGVFTYADGVIVTAGTGIFFSNDGQTWLNIGRASVSGSGDNYTAFTGRSTLTRTSQGQCQFTLFDGATFDYGQVIISDGANKPYIFRMEGTGALTSRTFFTEEITVTGTKGVKYVTTHDKHLIAAGVEDNLSTVFYSATLDPTSFSGTGSGSIVVEDQIEGIRGFRNELFIFCTNSIFKLININDSSNIAIVPVTKNVGCLSGYSIQEIGGDLIFLAPDGLRTVAGTARIGDVELGTISQNIQPIINDIVLNKSQYQFSSVVIRTKSQYRMFYSKTTDSTSTSKGIIGVLRPQGFEWSETLGIQAPAICSGFDSNGEEKFYHGDRDGYIYNHNVGNTFNPAGVETAVNAEYQSPDYDYGDLGTLKTLDYVKLSITPESLAQPTLRVRFDYDDLDTPQPVDIPLTAVPEPALFGAAVFNNQTFGAAQQPLVRQALTGSGHSNFFKIFSSDTRAPYTINGIYINYRPAGRQ